MKLPGIIYMCHKDFEDGGDIITAFCGHNKHDKCPADRKKCDLSKYIKESKEQNNVDKEGDCTGRPEVL